jgi:hypothetical protein
LRRLQISAKCMQAALSLINASVCGCILLSSCPIQDLGTPSDSSCQDLCGYKRSLPASAITGAGRQFREYRLSMPLMCTWG